MKLKNSFYRVSKIFFFLIAVNFFTVEVSAEPKIAVLVPEKSRTGEMFAEKLADTLARNAAKILDASLSASAYAAQKTEKPFNLTVESSKLTGAAIGCDYFLLIKSENQRRVSLSKGEYYESYAAVFAVSARSGQLVFWKLNAFEAAKPLDADEKLFASAGDLAREISETLQTTSKAEQNEKPAAKPENMPEENSPEAKNFRVPLPYKRLRPEYTPLADFYLVEATIDIEADIDETGKILKTRIVRWAGYGLDESVAETIKKMNWRPAERAGKTLATRVLLRYNFKKIESE